MAKNLFLQICEELHIPHTRSFANRTFDEHPYKYSLFGLSRMLSDYGVENQGVRFNERDTALDEILVPFVAQVSGDLALVIAIDADHVTYRWNDELVHISREQFLHIWSGVALILASDEQSGEPHYAAHHRDERVRQLKRWGAVSSIAILLAMAIVIRHSSFFTLHSSLLPSLTGRGWGWVFFLFTLNLAGLYLSYLLLLRQMKIASSTADRLCNLLKHTTCTDLLDTPASKAAYDISWSEIGTAYFAVNALVLILVPQALPVLALFAFGAVGYSVWSLWYQRFRAHAWCTLCLLVQAVFILQAIICILFIFHSSLVIYHSSFIILHLSLLLFSYLAATLTLHLSLPIISKARQADQWRCDFRNFKLRREVFDALLLQEKRYEVGASSSILFGDPDAPYRLTILTNPYCNPCAAMHARMSGIRQTGCCVEMVFSSFGEEYDHVCHLMIAAYQQLGADRAWQLYEEWYDKGKAKQEAFFDGLGLDADAESVLAEYAQHRAWREQTGFSATPTLLVNGYRMPSTYQMEDFVDLMKVETV